MPEESIEKNFSEYPKFFVKVDSECETVTFECLQNSSRKVACKKHKLSDEELCGRIEACLLSYSCKSKLSKKRAQMIASNCMKQDAHFKHLGFMSKESLSSFMSENFALLSEVKPKSVGWKRFLLDIGAVYKNKPKENK